MAYFAILTLIDVNAPQFFSIILFSISGFCIWCGSQFLGGISRIIINGSEFEIVDLIGRKQKIYLISKAKLELLSSGGDSNYVYLSLQIFHSKGVLKSISIKKFDNFMKLLKDLERISGKEVEGIKLLDAKTDEDYLL
ncbi:MAG: hypothetical protein AABX38_03720 [Candidatus Micrarchaeota archaeon]